MAYKDLNKSAEDINDILDNALLKTQQTLTEQQKTQVKTNLGISNTSITFSATSSASVPLTITINDVPKKVTYLYASEAKKLSTSRTIWGQPFDGSVDVDGNFTLTEGNVKFEIKTENPSYVTFAINGASCLAFDSVNKIVRPGTSLDGACDLGAAHSRWYRGYFKGLTIADIVSLSDISPTCIKTSGDNPFFGFRYNSKNWYFQGYNQVAYLGQGTTNGMRLDDSGNITIPGKLTENSDIRAKDIVDSIKVSIDDIAKLSTIKYKWNGWKKRVIKSDDVQIGGIAQEMEKILPEAVLNNDGLLSMDYAKCAYIFAVTLAKELKEIKEQMLNR
ncbi:MAG: tail fiber domain-containing protein [Phocaeicola sp.]|nr:tail fiber domain-containing protein [Phocaeicola sp.]